MADKKSVPSMIGFKPTKTDIKMVDDLLKHLKAENPVFAEKLTTSDVLRTAISELHKSLINNPNKRYGANK